MMHGQKNIKLVFVGKFWQNILRNLLDQWLRKEIVDTNKFLSVA